VYFQRFYDACLKGTREEIALGIYEKKRVTYIGARFKPWSNEPEV
jgi:hypothetical protein